MFWRHTAPYSGRIFTDVQVYAVTHLLLSGKLPLVLSKVQEMQRCLKVVRRGWLDVWGRSCLVGHPEGRWETATVGILMGFRPLDQEWWPVATAGCFATLQGRIQGGGLGWESVLINLEEHCTPRVVTAHGSWAVTKATRGGPSTLCTNLVINAECQSILRSEMGETQGGLDTHGSSTAPQT